MTHGQIYGIIDLRDTLLCSYNILGVEWVWEKLTLSWSTLGFCMSICVKILVNFSLLDLL